MFRQHVLPFLVWAFYRMLSLSWRKVLVEPPAMQLALAQRKPFILAHWHGDELSVIHLVKRYKLATMTSTSRDGELMGQVLRRLGAKTAPGSSTRGGIQALKGLVRLCRQGYPTSMAVDGPKGPIHQIKPGVFQLSHLAEAPIFALGVAYRRGFVFEKSWNKTYLPWPFTKVVMVFSEPLPALRNDLDPRSPEYADLLYQRLADAKQQASKLIAQ